MDTDYPDPSLSETNDSLVYIDVESLCQEIAARCACQLGIQYAWHANTLNAGIRLVSRFKPKIVIVGVDLPDADTFEHLTELRPPDVARPLMVICNRCDEGLFYNVYRGHIRGVVVQSPHLVEELAAAARSLLSGGTWCSPAFKTIEKRLMTDSNAFFRFLTKREFELLREFALGATDDMVAELKVLACGTVQGFRKQILRKLNLHSSRDLMVWALEVGLVRQRDFLIRRRFTAPLTTADGHEDGSFQVLAEPNQFSC